MQRTFRNSISKSFEVAPRGMLTFRFGKDWYQVDAAKGPPQTIGPVPESDIIGAGMAANFRGALDRHNRPYRVPDVGRKWTKSPPDLLTPKRSKAGSLKSEVLKETLRDLEVTLNRPKKGTRK